MNTPYLFHLTAISFTSPLSIIRISTNHLSRQTASVSVF